MGRGGFLDRCGMWGVKMRSSADHLAKVGRLASKLVVIAPVTVIPMVPSACAPPHANNRNQVKLNVGPYSEYGEFYVSPVSVCFSSSSRGLGNVVEVFPDRFAVHDLDDHRQVFNEKLSWSKLQDVNHQEKKVSCDIKFYRLPVFSFPGTLLYRNKTCVISRNEGTIYVVDVDADGMPLSKDSYFCGYAAINFSLDQDSSIFGHPYDEVIELRETNRLMHSMSISNKTLYVSGLYYMRPRRLLSCFEMIAQMNNNSVKNRDEIRVCFKRQGVSVKPR